jgi:hypothetical protein
MLTSAVVSIALFGVRRCSRNDILRDVLEDGSPVRAPDMASLNTLDNGGFGQSGSLPTLGRLHDLALFVVVDLANHTMPEFSVPEVVLGGAISVDCIDFHLCIAIINAVRHRQRPMTLAGGIPVLGENIGRKDKTYLHTGTCAALKNRSNGSFEASLARSTMT